jgi:GNAT superfamily N-acetyltransferase
VSGNSLRFAEIVTLSDDLLLPWLDLYEVAFPPSEKELVSSHLRLLKEKERGLAQDQHLLAALDGEGKLIAMAKYEFLPRCSAACLAYLAVRSDARSQGIGARVYQEIRRQLTSVSCRALVLEVEIPGRAPSAEEAQLATRRIQFYRRLGAHLLRGVDYTQSVGPHQPPLPMHVTVHPFQPVDGEEAFELARCVLGKRLERAGELALE